MKMFNDDPKLAKYLCGGNCVGLRPVLYPSKKVINVPQSYCGAVYKHFEGYKPDSSKQVIDPVAEVAKIEDPKIRFYFEQVHKLCRTKSLPATSSDEYLRRTLGFSAAVASDGAGDDESDDASAVSSYVSTIESASDVADLGDFGDYRDYPTRLASV